MSEAERTSMRRGWTTGACAAGAARAAFEALVGGVFPDPVPVALPKGLRPEFALVRAHPVARVTIAGGLAKMTKLAQGRLDLHSRRGEVDFYALARGLREAGRDEALAAEVANANSA